MAVLITGAAGFIGMHVAEALLARGDEVIGVDTLNAYYDTRLKQARLDRLTQHAGFSFSKTDVADPTAIVDLIAGRPEATRIIHLAAQAGVRYSLKAPFDYIRANVLGQTAMLEAARALPKLECFIYASSSSVYGANTKVPFAVIDRADKPVSLYAATKRSGELIAESYHHLYGLPITGLRFFTVYGPWGRPDMAYYLFTNAITEGIPLTLYDGGRPQRDFTYIDDIVAGILGAVDATPESRHQVYNLGNNRTETVTKLVETIEKAVGRKALVEAAPLQPGDVTRTYADIDTSRQELGFDPKTTLEEGIPRFVAWYQATDGGRFVRRST
ncbi:MAG: GDP-mannose 4,6-dehydratase [Pseudomonadota bacterium]